jgi:hypothetical protein
MVAGWHIWMWRNKTNFEEDFQHPSNATYTILKMAKDIDNYTHHPLNPRQCDTVFIGWKKTSRGVGEA